MKVMNKGIGSRRKKQRPVRPVRIEVVRNNLTRSRLLNRGGYLNKELARITPA